jgi:phage terminase large subunit
MIYLYREPEQGEFCVIGADPAEGGDNSTFVVMSKFKSDVIMVGIGKEESSLLGHKLNHVGKWINKKTELYPCIGVERNTGAATIYVLKELNYPNLYKMPQSFVSTEEEQQEKYGWVTSISTRPKMLDDLALAIRQKAIKIPSKHIIDELFTFIRNERTGKAQADVGAHDDLVMALAITFQLYQTVPTPDDDYSEIPDDTGIFKKLGIL